LDALTTFPTAPASFYAASNPPTRFAVRQVLDQELQKALAQRDAAARQARFRSGGPVSHHEAEDGAGKENNGAAPGQDASSVGVKRDFFGRIIPQHQQSQKKNRPLAERDGNARGGGNGVGGIRVWVTYHEGLNNAVRKPLSLDDFLRGF
jgi:chromosome transmission fidelity protein 18